MMTRPNCAIQKDLWNNIFIQLKTYPVTSLTQQNTTVSASTRGNYALNTVRKKEKESAYLLEHSSMGKKLKKVKSAVKSTDNVDSEDVIMEIEKAENMFVPETESVSNSFRDSHINKGKLPESIKRSWHNSKAHQMKNIRRRSTVGFVNMGRQQPNKQLSKRNRKSCSDEIDTEDGYNKITYGEDGELLGKIYLKGFKAVEQNLQSTGGYFILREEDFQDCPEYKSSAALFCSNMMPHPTSDIAKVLQSKKNIKTKKNFQFKFNNFRRQNGSVATVLSTEGKILTCFTPNVDDKWCEVSKDIRRVIRPCSVRLSRLSEKELMNRGHLVNCKGGSISASGHKHRQTKMRKSRSEMPVKPTVRVPSEVDKTELHLELEKAASTFASEVKPNSYIPFEAEFENTESFVVSKKDKVSKAVTINKTSDKKGHMNSSNSDSDVVTNNVVRKNQKRNSARSSRNISDSRHAHVSIPDSEVEEEEWLGWNSRVTPLDTIPGGEIVSVKENNDVEELINWNMKIESDSDMDVEEVFLLTDLVEIKKRNVSTDISSDSEDEWLGWPEYKPPTTLYYIFKV